MKGVGADMIATAQKENFKGKKWQKNVIVVKDAIADRIPGAVYWNLFDMKWTLPRLCQQIMQLN